MIKTPLREIFRGLGEAERESTTLRTLPTGLKSVANTTVSYAETDGNMTALLSRPVLKSWGFKADLAAEEYSFSKLGIEKVDLPAASNGHVLVNVLEFDENRLYTDCSEFTEIEGLLPEGEINLIDNESNAFVQEMQNMMNDRDGQVVGNRHSYIPITVRKDIVTIKAMHHDVMSVSRNHSRVFVTGGLCSSRR